MSSRKQVEETKRQYDLSKRDARQRSAIPPDLLNKISAVVVGVGAIGRPLSLLLAATGVSHITLVDDDVVEEPNLAAQGYLETDLGESKVKACSQMMMATNSSILVDIHKRKLTPGLSRNILASHDAEDSDLVVFSAVDTIETRKMIWKHLGSNANMFIDGRMAGPVLQCLGINTSSTKDVEYYPTTLHATKDIAPVSCSARSLLYPCTVTAGLMVAQMVNFMLGLPTCKLISMDLLDLGAYAPEDTSPKAEEEALEATPSDTDEKAPTKPLSKNRPRTRSRSKTLA